MFYQFRFWDPVRYTNPGIKFPQNPDRGGRYLGIARTTGDALTYLILDDRERKDNRHVVLTRSCVRIDDGQNKTIQRIDRTAKDEEKSLKTKRPLCRDSTQEDGSEEDDEDVIQHDIKEMVKRKESDVEERTPDEELYDIIDIIGHRLHKKNRPELRILWSTGAKTWEPLRIIKEDIPEDVAKYVEENGLGNKFRSEWARKVNLTARTMSVTVNKLRRKTTKPTEMYGVKIPRNPAEALKFDE
jgi:hypothetical protein